NMGYMLWYLYRLERRRSARRNRLALLDGNRAKRQGYHNEITVNNGRRKRVVVTKDIICIIRWDKVGVILLKTGKVVQIDNTLNEMLAMLDLRFFAKSNRWCIINLR